MTFRDAMTCGEKVLTLSNVVDAKNDAWLLLAEACKIDRTYFYMHMNEEISDEQESEYKSLIKKRAEHVPLQYIIGEQVFMGLVFKVNNSVLIPRQDTETLVEETLKKCKPKMKVLDMCTGSGCILISVMKNVSDISGLGVDISKQALSVAKENAKINKVNAVFEQSNLFDKIREKFDIIVSNPPYIKREDIPKLMPEVYVFEPIEALDGMEDGLYFYRKIVNESIEHLNEGGYLLFEIGCDQGEDVSSMMRFAGYKDVKVIKDLAGNDRVVLGMR